MRTLLAALLLLAPLAGCSSDAPVFVISQDAFGSTDGTDPDIADPDVADPDVADPDVADPDGTELDATDPDGGEPDIEVPDAEVPDAEVPDAEVPDAEVPDVEIPDTEGPDVEVPDTTTDTTVPDTTTDATVPDTTTDTTVPDTTTDTTVPDTTTDTTVPDTTTDTTVPDTTTDTTVPDTTTDTADTTPDTTPIGGTAGDLCNTRTTCGPVAGCADGFTCAVTVAGVEQCFADCNPAGANTCGAGLRCAPFGDSGVCYFADGFCDVDSDCDSFGFPSGAFVCQGGSCLPPSVERTLGQSCEQADACAYNRCAEGLVCSANTCVDPAIVPEGGICDLSGELTGEVRACDTSAGDTCVSLGADLPWALCMHVCTADVDCSLDSYSCEPLLADGRSVCVQQCATNDECIGVGHSCADGLCVPLDVVVGETGGTCNPDGVDFFEEPHLCTSERDCIGTGTYGVCHERCLLTDPSACVARGEVCADVLGDPVQGICGDGCFSDAQCADDQTCVDDGGAGFCLTNVFGPLIFGDVCELDSAATSCIEGLTCLREAAGLPGLCTDSCTSDFQCIPALGRSTECLAVSAESSLCAISCVDSPCPTGTRCIAGTLCLP